MLTLALTVAGVMLGAAFVLNLWRLWQGPDAVDRVLALDTLYINTVALLLVYEIRLGTGIEEPDLRTADLTPFNVGGANAPLGRREALGERDGAGAVCRIEHLRQHRDLGENVVVVHSLSVPLYRFHDLAVNKMLKSPLD